MTEWTAPLELAHAYPDCSREFYPAHRTSGERDVSLIRWVVLHDGEAPSARSIAEYFYSLDAVGSAHLCVDDAACYRCLRNDAIPWGAASAFAANLHGVHIEQAGYAKWSAVVWRQHRATLDRAAFKTAQHLQRYGLPVRFVDAAHLPQLAGVTTHREITKASKRIDAAGAWKYTHMDPGALWPRRLFMARVRVYHDALS